MVPQYLFWCCPDFQPNNLVKRSTSTTSRKPTVSRNWMAAWTVRRRRTDNTWPSSPRTRPVGCSYNRYPDSSWFLLCWCNSSRFRKNRNRSQPGSCRKLYSTCSKTWDKWKYCLRCSSPAGSSDTNPLRGGPRFWFLFERRCRRMIGRISELLGCQTTNNRSVQEYWMCQTHLQSVYSTFEKEKQGRLAVFCFGFV